MEWRNCVLFLLPCLLGLVVTICPISIPRGTLKRTSLAFFLFPEVTR
jgi:hypothetical protein